MLCDQCEDTNIRNAAATALTTLLYKLLCGKDTVIVSCRGYMRFVQHVPHSNYIATVFRGPKRLMRPVAPPTYRVK